MSDNLSKVEIVAYLFIPPGIEEKIPEYADEISKCRAEVIAELEKLPSEKLGNINELEFIHPIICKIKDQCGENRFIQACSSTYYIKNIAHIAKACGNFKYGEDNCKHDEDNYAQNKYDYTQDKHNDIQNKIMKHSNDLLAICHGCEARGRWERCSRCKIAHYCSRECQKADWPLHKNMCKK